MLVIILALTVHCICTVDGVLLNWNFTKVPILLRDLGAAIGNDAEISELIPES